MQSLKKFTTIRRKKISDNYIDRLEKYVETSQKAIDYSLERFDILIISLSTSGLILSIGFVKDIIKDFTTVNHLLIKISWLVFASALVMNLISQVSGYYAHNFDLKVTKDIIRIKRGKSSKINRKRFERYHSFCNITTMILNAGSLLSLITGIITLIIFISKYV